AYGIKKEEICGITEWIMDSNSAYRERARWWSRDNLLKKKGIGQNWAYGQIFNLKQYEKPLVSASGYYSIQTNYVLNEGKELETILLRKNGANIILVGNDEAGKFQIISDLSKRIYEGQVLSSLNDKRVVLFNDKLMLIRNNSKQKFEIEFVKIMNEAVLAGNIILVFDDFSGFILGAETIGVDLPSILAPYLISSSLQIVAFTDKERFHSVLERNVLVSQHFEIILIKEIDNYGCIKVLENEVRVFENDGMFFTYPALVSIVTGGQRYFSDGIMPDKAIDFLQEIAPKLNSNGKRIVEEKDVVALIQTKTGIPMGDVGPKEKEKLLNLESLLSKKIIGQNEAVVAISHAVRRARSGINNPNRPLGSFLFLGSTGVGKTETSKVLAEVFFGQDANIIRLDMSEYSGPDSVAKLIGSFGKSQAGTLSTMLKEHPYGVLLLDEFEKTTQEVMNLFLQILDEGLFSDGSGNKVNARNLIIIATSNAGSQIIWKKQQNGDDLMKAKDEIVESIIQEGVFKAELINRFDGVILFHPLDEASISKIAELLLYKLHDRLADRGIDLVVNQDLIDFVVGFGFDPKFGARTMYRVIQEKVEEIIAEKIIAGTGVAGQKFILSKEDLV
ncbi:MAG: AAA family ATPase, partial [Parcubacteria group bacterium]